MQAIDYKILKDLKLFNSDIVNPRRRSRQKPRTQREKPQINSTKTVNQELKQTNKQAKEIVSRYLRKSLELESLGSGQATGVYRCAREARG